jgi:hypothetical protein
MPVIDIVTDYARETFNDMGKRCHACIAYVQVFNWGRCVVAAETPETKGLP